MKQRPAKPPPPRPAKRGPQLPKKSRRSGGDSLWIWGRHAVEAALANPERVRLNLLATEQAARSLSGEFKLVSRRHIDQALPEGSVHQGLALLTRPLAEVFLEDICHAAADQESTCVVVLDQASDPHNIGAVLRSAEAFGAKAVILPRRHAPQASGVMAKAASGALERVSLIHVANLVRALATLKETGFLCLGLDGRAETPLKQVRMPTRIALVLGSEGKGLRPSSAATCDVLAKIPLSAGAESLNLSNAAAIALYEMARMR